MNKIKNWMNSIKIFDNYRIFFIVPLIIILITLVCGTVYQLSDNYDKFANIGVDFQGGTLLNVKMESNDVNVQVDMNTTNKDYNVNIISDVLANHGFEIATVQASGDSALVVRYSYVAYGNDSSRDAIDYGSNEKTAEMNEINEEIMDEIEVAFKNDAKYEGKDISIETTASLIGTTSSMNLLKTALISVAIALAVMFIYIIIRFDIFSALSVIITLLHDVIMMMSLTVIFRVEIGSTIVAAIITIVAYSINNTIVVFDRLRENIKPYKKEKKNYNIPLVVDDAIKGTIVRTVYTTLTTLITISILAIMGVSTIRTFALPIIFGLFAGFYSSVTIAAPLWGLFNQGKEKSKLKKDREKYKNKYKTNKAIKTKAISKIVEA